MTKRVLCTLLVALACSAVATYAECMIFGPPYATAMLPLSNYVGVTFLTGSSQPTNCTPGYTMTAMGAVCVVVLTPSTKYNCPAATMGGMCRGLLAKLPLTALPGTFRCSWMCDCGAGPETFVIDNADGLPVELMEFSVDEGYRKRSEAP